MLVGFLLLHGVMAGRIEQTTDSCNAFQTQSFGDVLEAPEHHVDAVRDGRYLSCVGHGDRRALEVVHDRQNLPEGVLDGTPANLFDLFARSFPEIVKVGRDTQELLAHPIALGMRLLEVAGLRLRLFPGVLLREDDLFVFVLAAGPFVLRLFPRVFAHALYPSSSRFS